MNIPDKIKISGIVYDVKLTDEVLILNNVRCYGMIDYNNQIIKIDKSLQGGQGLEVTLLHEIMHAICNDRDIDLGEDEETLVQQFAKGIYQLLKDNDLRFR